MYCMLTELLKNSSLEETFFLRLNFINNHGTNSNLD